MGTEKQAGRRVGGRVDRGRTRRRDDYTNEAFAGSDSDVLEGNYCLNTTLCRVRLFVPSGKGLLVCRLWSSVCYDDPDVLEPGRTSEAVNGMGHFMRKARVASGGLFDQSSGCRPYSFIPANLTDHDTLNNSPAHITANAGSAAFFAIKKGDTVRGWNQKWNPILFGGTTDIKYRALKAPGFRWFFQGHVYQSGEKSFLEKRDKPFGLDDSDPLGVIMVSESAGRQFCKLFGRPRDPEPAEVKNPADLYQMGDPCGTYDPVNGTLVGGRIIVFWNPKEYKSWKLPDLTDAKGNVIKNSGRTVTSWDGELPTFQGYEVYAPKKFVLDGVEVRPSMGKADVDQIFNKTQYWTPDQENTEKNDGLLRVLNFEEQALVIAKGFIKYPDFVRFIFQEIPEYLRTDEITGMLNARRQAAQPGLPDEQDENDDEPRAEEPAKRRRRDLDEEPVRRTRMPVEELPAEEEDLPEVSDLEDEFEEEAAEVPPPPVKKTGPKPVTPPTRKPAPAPVVVDDDLDDVVLTGDDDEDADEFAEAAAEEDAELAAEAGDEDEGDVPTDDSPDAADEDYAFDKIAGDKSAPFEEDVTDPAEAAEKDTEAKMRDSLKAAKARSAARTSTVKPPAKPVGKKSK